MNVNIEKGTTNTVSITGDFQGPYVCLDISAQDAYSLYQALHKQRDVLEDLATNYYSCSECGEDHHIGTRCPAIEGDNE